MLDIEIGTGPLEGVAFALPASDFSHFDDMHALIPRLSPAAQHERAAELARR